jgi:hypothetical protein
MNALALASPVGPRLWQPPVKPEFDNVDYWSEQVHDDDEWMITEAKDVLSKNNPDGEVVLEAYDSLRVLRKLRDGHDLEAALQGRQQQTKDAVVRLLNRLIQMGDELRKEVEGEALDRAELAQREWEAARGY